MYENLILHHSAILRRLIEAFFFFFLNVVTKQWFGTYVKGEEGCGCTVQWAVGLSV